MRGLDSRVTTWHRIHKANGVIRSGVHSLDLELQEPRSAISGTKILSQSSDESSVTNHVRGWVIER